MFETSTVRARAVAQSQRMPLLVTSIAAHTIVVAAIIIASLTSISFPRNAPNELAPFIPFQPVVIPPPLGVRTPQARPAVQTPHTQTAPATPVAPTHVPDATPTLPATSGDSSASTAPGAGPGNQPYGDPNGDPNGIDIGQQASTDIGPGTDVVYVPGADVRAATVLQRVEPQFPRAAALIRLSGVVVIRCVIDKTGQIRDPEIVSSTFAAFNQPALDALRQWKFAPGSMRGKPVDTWFELTIRFSAR